MNKAIGERIRIARVSRSWSQENMASELDLSTGAYSNIERGKTEISVSRLFRIAKILKTSPVHLLDLDEHLPQMTNEPPAEYKNVSKQLHLLTNKVDTFQHIIEKQKKEIQSLRESIGKGTRRRG